MPLLVPSYETISVLPSYSADLHDQENESLQAEWHWDSGASSGDTTASKASGPGQEIGGEEEKGEPLPWRTFRKSPACSAR